MTAITLSNFGGVAPRYAPALLKPNMASEAENVRLDHGTLAPFRMPLPVFEAPVPCARTMFCFAGRWLSWDSACVDVAPWLPGCERVYVTGAADYPQFALAPVPEQPLTWRRLGVPVPVWAPHVSVQDHSIPPRTTSTRRYVLSYVNSMGEEGAPSPPSIAVEVAEGAAVALTWMVPPNDWDVQFVRVYRVAEGFNDGVQAAGPTASAYLFVAELPATTLGYLDVMPTDQLGEANTTLTYLPPPEALHSITALPNGVLAGAVGRKVWFCEPYQPHAWPVDYVLELDDAVCALRWSNGVLYALTDGHPYVISEQCVDGNCCRKAQRLSVPAPIVSSKSAVATATGVVYATPNGLMALSGQQMKLISAPWFAIDDWQALRPNTMQGAYWEGQYVGAACTGSFLFKLGEGIHEDGHADHEWMPLTLTPNALYTTRDGVLHLAFGNVLHEWDAGVKFLPYRWRSKQFASGGQANFAAARVTFDGYPAPAIAPFGVRFRWLTDGRVALDRPVRHEAPFRLPSKRRNFEFAVEVRSAETVRAINVATRLQELSHLDASDY